MAQRSKSKKNQSPGPSSLKKEKDSKLTVSQLLRDERTHKITGAAFLLISIFLFIAFTSYLFTWREDQAKIWKIALLRPSEDLKVANLLGNLGAYVSHIFFSDGFGIASYLVCSFFFITGVNWLFAKKYFSIRRNLRYVFIGLVYVSTTLAFVSRGGSFFWGGAFGNMTSDWLTRFLGKIGTACVLFAGAMSYFIWRFNPAFKLPEKKLKNLSPVAVTEPKKTDDPGAMLFIQEPLTKNKKNKLKSEGEIPLFVAEEPALQDESSPFLTELPLKKDFPQIPISKSPKKTTPDLTGLELEINALPEAGNATPVNGQEKLPVTETKSDGLADYEPTLDLLP